MEDEEANDKRMAAISLAASLGGGFLLSHFDVGLDSTLPLEVQQWSSALGWSYVLAWSISFYPQVRQQGWEAARVTCVVELTRPPTLLSAACQLAETPLAAAICLQRRQQRLHSLIAVV